MTTTSESTSLNVKLVDYFIYCPLLCEKEGQEHRKILYYYPSDSDVDRQTTTIGYCEGLVKFAETFAFDDPCDCVHFQKTRLLFYQVENDICIAMTLRVPSSERRTNEKSFMEYYDENINDRLMLSVLKMSYRYFVLEYGTISSLIQINGVEKSKIVLKQYFDKFVEYRLQTMILDTTIDSSYSGVQFLPLEKSIYLKIQSLLRKLELRFTSLKDTLFLHRNQLIWSGFNQDETSILFSFFRCYYWTQIKSSFNTSNLRYLKVQTSEPTSNTLIISTDLIIQVIFLGDLSLPYQLVVINFNVFTIFCAFYNDEELSNNEKTLATLSLLKKDLDELLSCFEESTRKKNPAIDTTVKNIYFNKINLAHSSSMDLNRELASNNLVGVMNTLSEDLQWFHPSGEIMVKRENDPWLIAKRSDMRELLVMINQKTANLKEISDKIKQMLSTQFNNILILE